MVDLMNELCKECWRYETFKEKCHFYWEEKRECSRWISHETDEEKYKSIIENKFLF